VVASVAAVDRTVISAIAHTDHPVAAPVCVDEVRRLVGHLDPPRGGNVVDLGCGWGIWLLELLAARPDLTGVGVDVSLPDGLPERAEGFGVADRVTWVQADASDWDGGAFDAVLCVGASHAFGGLSQTLDGVRRVLRPGGRVLLGDATWESDPSPAALEALGASPDDFLTLGGLVDRARAAGFEPTRGHVSTLAEWDDYEWSWTGSLATWALEPGRDPADAAEALTAARTHRDQWLKGYRGVLGFVTLVLHDVR